MENKTYLVFFSLLFSNPQSKPLNCRPMPFLPFHAVIPEILRKFVG